MATIYDVARMARVSTTTVSKVLSNTPYVSAKTRQRVLDAMQELKYSPSLAARGLSSNRTYVIGLIVPQASDHSFKDPFLLEIIQGVERTANDSGYNVLLSMPERSASQNSYDRFLHPGYVDGIVTFETFEGFIADQELAEYALPRVSIGYREDHQEVNSIHSDDRLGAYEGVKHLLELGHRHIGVISGPTNFIVAVDARLQGVRDALTEYGLSLDMSWVTYGDFSIQSGYQAASPLLAAKDRPTALFVMNDRMALGAMRRASEIGLHVPVDLSLVGFDDVPLAEVIEPPLTTIRQFPIELGTVATQQLFSLINNETVQFPSVVIPIEFVVRSSTARLG
jgi:DNA-binding LacI/PurR family transcriptional regulator